MLDLQIKRHTLTVPECRYFIFEVLQGVLFLHQSKIIHRDLKPGNIFLDNKLHIKIGDFGLATKFTEKDDRKQTFCGTPNYMAPEMMSARGHSYKADVWSIGCMLYTLLVGTPPFDGAVVENTYTNIRSCYYKIPLSVHEEAASLIKLTVQRSPARRPSVDKMLKHEFIHSSFRPISLPRCCFYTSPKINELDFVKIDETRKDKPNPGTAPAKKMSVAEKNIKMMQTQLTSLLGADFKKIKCRTSCLPDELSEPAAPPLVWVCESVSSPGDGFGYTLSNNTCGLLFEDNTNIFINDTERKVYYINEQGLQTESPAGPIPGNLPFPLKLKAGLILTKYMSRLKGRRARPKTAYVIKAYKTSEATVMLFSTRSLQMDFNDNTKLIICPKRTILYGEENLRAFRFRTIKEHGCPQSLRDKLKSALEELNKLATKPD